MCTFSEIRLQSGLDTNFISSALQVISGHQLIFMFSKIQDKWTKADSEAFTLHWYFDPGQLYSKHVYMTA